MIDRETVDRVFAAANIVEIIGDYVTLKKKGVNYVACCPFHNEKTPSFVVSPSKGVYKCFGCGEGGNAVNFVMKHESMTFPEALKAVAKRYGIEIKERELSEEEVRRILAHFTAPVYWCLCPRSNRYISRLEPPVALLRSLGARICLGTDSLASNRSLSLLDELRALGGVPLRESLRWATLGGAEALGLDDALGTVAPGKRPGLNLLTGLDFERMALTPDTRVKPLL